VRTVSEAQLVAALRRGEAAAFDEVYLRYRERIFRFLCRMSGRRDVAEDLFQETFLQLARHAPRLDEDSDLGAWLYTVARNRLRSHRRWAALDVLGRRALPESDQDGQQGRGGEGGLAADAALAVSELERALAALPPERREVLVLLGVEGLPPEQVARILGISGEALRQRLARARAELAERIGAPARPARTARAQDAGRDERGNHATR
jgi:RNA polymerase sigma-70 factor, ECF subfamily